MFLALLVPGLRMGGGGEIAPTFLSGGRRFEVEDRQGEFLVSDRKGRFAVEDRDTRFEVDAR